MKPTLTPRPLLRELAALCARRLRRACEDTGVSLAALAHALDRSPTVAERWASEADDTHHLPVYVLAHRQAFPDALFERLVADLRALREAQVSETSQTSEAAAAALVSRTGDLLAELGRSLSDGRISASEAHTLRPLLAALRPLLERADRALASTEAS